MEVKKIKILDILFIVLLAVFLLIVFKQKTQKQTTTYGYSVLFVLEADEIEAVSTNYVKEGDIAIDKRRNNTVGKVESIEINEPIDNPNSEYKGIDDGRKNSDEFKSIRIKIRTDANLNSDGIYINGVRYLLGEELTYTIGDLQVFAKLKNIEGGSNEK